MNGTRNYHAWSGNTDPIPYASHMLTNKYILGKKVQNSHDIKLKEANKSKNPITLGREKKTLRGVGIGLWWE